MKTLIRTLIIFSLMLPMTIIAQTNTPKSGDYIQDNNIDKFVGSWLWKSGNSSFQLILREEKRVKLIPTMDITTDVIYGFHKFIQNGEISENSLQYVDTTYNDRKSTLLGGCDTNNHKKLTGSIIHTSKNKNIKFEIEYIDPTHIKLIKLENYEGVRINVSGQRPYDPSISLPQDIILTKQ